MNAFKNKLQCVIFVKSQSHVWLFCNTTDCSPPGSSILWILQTRIVEWVAISLSRRSSQPKNWICISTLAGKFFTTEPPGKPWILKHFPLKLFFCFKPNILSILSKLQLWVYCNHSIFTIITSCKQEYKQHKIDKADIHTSVLITAGYSWKNETLKDHTLTLNYRTVVNWYIGSHCLSVKPRGLWNIICKHIFQIFIGTYSWGPVVGLKTILLIE